MSDATDYQKRYVNDYPLWLKEIVGVPPTDYQAAASRDLVKHKFVSIKSGTTTGKTMFDATMALWFFTTRPESKVVMTAPTGHQLEDLLMAEIRTWKNRIKFDLLRESIKILNDKIYIEGFREWYMAPRTIPKDAKDKLGDVLAGFHAPHLLFICDESAGIPTPVFSGIEGSMIQKNVYCLLTGNPTRANGYFYDTHNKNKNQWCCLTFSSKDSPFVDQDFIQRMIDLHGEESDFVRTKILGEFPKGGARALVDIDTLYERFEAHKQFDIEEAKRLRPLVAGLDPAAGKRDYAVLTFRAGAYVFPPIRIFCRDTVDLMQQTHKLMRKWRASELYIDYLGLGIPIYHVMRRKAGYRTYAMIANSRASDPDGFMNLRGELYFQLSGGFDELLLPAHDRYIQELPEINFIDDGRNRIGVEKKDVIKSRLGFSPDYSDSLMTSTLRHFNLGQLIGANVVMPRHFMQINDNLIRQSAFQRI